MPASLDLVHGQDDIGRAHHLALLDVQRQAGAGRGQQQIGLAAEKSRYLDDRKEPAGRFGLPGLVDVGQYRDMQFGLDLLQDRQSFFDARTAGRTDRGAVGLVERGLENEGDAEFGADFFDFGGDLAGQPFVLDDAGTGDQEEAFVGQFQVIYLEESLHGLILSAFAEKGKNYRDLVKSEM